MRYLFLLLILVAGYQSSGQIHLSIGYTSMEETTYNLELVKSMGKKWGFSGMGTYVIGTNRVRYGSLLMGVYHKHYFVGNTMYWKNQFRIGSMDGFGATGFSTEMGWSSIFMGVDSFYTIHKAWTFGVRVGVTIKVIHSECNCYSY